MHIEVMSEDECLTFISDGWIGRLACCHADRPYIVPIHYVLSGGLLYSFSMPGRKLDAMRSNPNVCVEIDVIEKSDTWTSVVVEGIFQEMALPQDKDHAWEILKQHNTWWEVGAQKVRVDSPADHSKPTFFVVTTDVVSGRKAISS